MNPSRHDRDAIHENEPFGDDARLQWKNPAVTESVKRRGREMLKRIVLITMSVFGTATMAVAGMPIAAMTVKPEIRGNSGASTRTSTITAMPRLRRPERPAVQVRKPRGNLRTPTPVSVTHPRHPRLTAPPHGTTTPHRFILQPMTMTRHPIIGPLWHNTRPCPSGWRLVSGKATGAYTCKRATTPRCAVGYRMKRGACTQPVSAGGIHLGSSKPLCTYQCIPEKPRFKPKCAKGYGPSVGACKVGCVQIPQ